MKLLFLCTSLEPGRDGVGDYVRLLAEACIDAGHSCRLIALNDAFVTTGGVEWQHGRNHDLQCYRFSTSEAWHEKLSAAQSVIHEFAPDWVSWQVVPYGFHPKGLMPHELNAFSILGRNRFVHLMLHELWIGLSRGEPLKNLAWGSLQRRRLLHFMRAINPSLIHTSNPVYQTVLAREGCSSHILPLFGNVPIGEIVPPVPSNQEWLGGIFGTVHPQFQPEPCFSVLSAGAKASGRKLRILGIGRLGPYGEEMFAKLKTEYKGQLEAAVVGEKEPAELSRLLQTLDFGIGTHPWALLGKSGAVAAMLDHGLPVIVPRDDWVLRVRPLPVPAIDRLVVKLSEMPPELMAGRIARKRPPAARLPEIAGLFTESLEAVAANLQFEA
jgi:hypothetical protein